MKLGKQVFIERIGAEAEERTVRRDQAIADNALLPAAMATLIGDKARGAISRRDLRAFLQFGSNPSAQRFQFATLSLGPFRTVTRRSVYADLRGTCRGLPGRSLWSARAVSEGEARQRVYPAGMPPASLRVRSR